MAEKEEEEADNDGNMRKYYLFTCFLFTLMAVYCFMYCSKWG